MVFITCDFWSASSLKKELLSVELLLKNLPTLAHLKRLSKAMLSVGVQSSERNKNITK